VTKEKPLPSDTTNPLADAFHRIMVEDVPVHVIAPLVRALKEMKEDGPKLTPNEKDLIAFVRSKPDGKGALIGIAENGDGVAFMKYVPPEQARLEYLSERIVNKLAREEAKKDAERPEMAPGLDFTE